MMLSLPSGTKRVVIFDTNGYRNLCLNLTLDQTRQKVVSLRALEQSQGIIALAHPIVIQELVFHLADANDPHFTHCLHGLVSLAEHTNAPGGISLFAGDIRSILCQELFGEITPECKHYHDVLNAFANHVRKHAPHVVDNKALEQIKIISQELQQGEQDWVSGMKKVLQKHNPTWAEKWEFCTDDSKTQKDLRAFFESEQFRMDMAMSLAVLTHAQISKSEISPEVIKKMSKVVYEEFGTPLRLYARILAKMATPGGYTLEHRKKKRGNYLWDFQIGFAIGNKHEIDGCAISLVTHDRDIRKAAKEEGCDNRVMTLQDYFSSIGYKI